MRKIARPYADPAPLFRHGGARPAGRLALLDFSASINPLGPPKSVLEALRAALPDIAHYPDPECRELTERIAAYHHVDPAMVVVGNGSNELIYAIARALRPKRVAIAEPTYTEYLRASLLVGAGVDHWLAEGTQFKLTPFEPEGADIVWLANPNNPTGNMWASAAYLARWMEAHPRSQFVMDEAFLPLRPEACLPRGYPPSLIPYVGPVENLIVLSSLTKLYALPGLRLGYAIARPEVARKIRSELVPWSVNGLALIAGRVALEDADFYHRTWMWLADQAGTFGDHLQRASANLTLLRSQTNFVLVRLKGITAPQLVEQLAPHGILIRDASNFVGLDDRYVRIAIRTEPENQRLFNALAAVLRG